MLTQFEEFIESRCEDVLLANKEYRKLQNEFDEAYKRKDIEKSCEVSMRMVVVVCNVCYRLGIKDIYSILNDI